LLDRDIIVALGTPIGEAAIGIVRLSGSGCIALVEKFFVPKKKGLLLSKVASHTVHLGVICDREGKVLDEVLVNVMRAPRTYTREDVVEVYCHGGIVPVRAVLRLFLENGARLAEPGEFTKRAFLNGRIDLAQAEAVLDVIRARTENSALIAVKNLRGELSEAINRTRATLRSLLIHVEAEIDFPEDVDEMTVEQRLKQLRGLKKDLEKMIKSFHTGRYYREGLATAIVGKPNVGKSTLLNLFLGEERAIVTDIPGTTRDLIEEVVNVHGVPLRLIDTAGIREHVDVVEKIGIERTRRVIQDADLVLVLLDAADGLTEEDFQVINMVKGKNVLLVVNKIDSPVRKIDKKILHEELSFPVIEISAKLGWGFEELKNQIIAMVGNGVVGKESFLVTNFRHFSALTKALNSLNEAEKALQLGLPLDCLAVDLWEAWSALGEITGDTVSEEVIEQIFKEFCVGK